MKLIVFFVQIEFVYDLFYFEDIYNETQQQQIDVLFTHFTLQINTNTHKHILLSSLADFLVSISNQPSGELLYSNYKYRIFIRISPRKIKTA